MQLKLFASVILVLLVALNAYAAAPTITSLVVNSTYSSNSTLYNITAYAGYSDSDGDNVTIAYDWRVNGSSVAVFQFNFDTNNSGGTGKTYDFSSTNSNGTVTNAVWNASGGVNRSGAYYFNGNSYINVSESPLHDMATGHNYTIMLWMKTGVSGSLYRLVSRQPIGSPGGMYHLRLGYHNFPPVGDFADVNKIEFEIGNSSSAEYRDLKSSVDVNDNNWHHVVAMRNGSSITLYIDGNFDNTTNISSNMLNLVGNAGNNDDLYIGGGGPAVGEGFIGHIDDVRFYNRSFSAQEIRAIYENKSYLVLNTTIKPGENWTLCVTPQDKTSMGSRSCSSTLLVRAHSCTAPAANNNWAITAADHCTFTNQNIALGTGSLTVAGSGIITLTTTNITAANISMRSGATVKLSSRSRLGKS